MKYIEEAIEEAKKSLKDSKELLENRDATFLALLKQVRELEREYGKLRNKIQVSGKTDFSNNEVVEEMPKVANQITNKITRRVQALADRVQNLTQIVKSLTDILKDLNDIKSTKK